MIIYHEADPDAADSILASGLKRTSRGAKGDETDIARTDQFLDERRPEALKNQNVSRDDNLYGFIHTKGALISITDGASLPLQEFVDHSDQAVFQLEVDPVTCYVSDLDLYDRVRTALTETGQKSEAEELAEQYWQTLVSLQSFRVGSIRRPEVMITTDIASDAIRLIKKE